jgi:type II secretory pathway pseudopilin PulG
VNRSIRGAALLEALVALTLLGTVGSAAAWSATESLRAVQRMHAREAEQRAAERFFASVSLWPREDLDRHLGSHSQGRWRLRVDRPQASLYAITLSDTTSSAVLLQTALYRDEGDR